MSLDLESIVVGLRAGITAATAFEVGNDRSQVQQVLTAIGELRTAAKSVKINPDQEAALAEVQANVTNGAAIVTNKRAGLLAMLDVFDALKSAKVPELLKD